MLTMVLCQEHIGLVKAIYSVHGLACTIYRYFKKLPASSVQYYTNYTVPVQWCLNLNTPFDKVRSWKYSMFTTT